MLKLKDISVLKKQKFHCSIIQGFKKHVVTQNHECPTCALERCCMHNRYCISHNYFKVYFNYMIYIYFPEIPPPTAIPKATQHYEVYLPRLRGKKASRMKLIIIYALDQYQHFFMKKYCIIFRKMKEKYKYIYSDNISDTYFKEHEKKYFKIISLEICTKRF